ncbi:DUF885 domain-containing protein [Alteromonas oceanisediminis]|uniref:DUF885 domain-containing protein n=1 Tax=Alteromonas oceanisediminis TaxID=2836180 RepID=UPI001BDB2C48|nr:DUF885 domain-containing protein [Alteromonas oceanisediminis]MBT0585280.1 DUF885 family protein [Alteromonas oceanisediminis]
MNTPRTALAMALATALMGSCLQPVYAVQSTTTAPVEAASTHEQQSETERLNAWFEAQYEQQLQQSPLRMTSLGRKDRYGEIDDMSEAAADAQFAKLEQSVTEMQSTFDYNKLTDDAKISYDLWIYGYETAKAMRPYSRRSYVFTQMSGAQSSLPNLLINFHNVSSEQDIRDYISRVSGLGRAISQLLTRAQVHAEEGVRAPYFAYDGVIEQATNLITGAPFAPDSDTDAPLYADAKRKIGALEEAGNIDTATAQALTASVEQALIKDFEPAYAQLIAWMQTDRANVSEEATGMGALPDGVAAYNAALRSNTTTAMTADEIHALGLAEVARIRAEMETIKADVGFDGSLQAFFDLLKSSTDDERFYYPNTDAGRQGYLDDSTAYLDYIKDKLPEYFGLLPKADLVVKRVEAFREQPGAAQHYYPGTPDGSRDGIYYAHLSDMTAMPKNEMEAIAYHEGNPGHHMQISIAQELTGVPTFRTQQFFTAYIEGWALYSELLAKEMGAYQNPYSDFGRLVTEIWRAIRLVVDTGLHAKGWTEQQAIDYFKQNSPIAEDAVRSEVRRYLVWPGQATAYKIGMLKILELREKAQRALGDQFDIRGFHDVVLGGGAVPMPILERMVDDWIAHEKAKSA